MQPSARSVLEAAKRTPMVTAEPDSTIRGGSRVMPVALVSGETFQDCAPMFIVKFG